MLLTCFKHDFKALSRILVPVLICIGAAAVLGFCDTLIVFGEKPYDIMSGNLIGGMLSASAIGGLIVIAMLLAAAVTVMMVLIFVRFYRSMVTDEAYLTFTLPVSAGTLIASKFLASLVWMLIGSAAICAAGLVILTGVALADADFTFGEAMRAVWDLMREVFSSEPLVISLGCLYAVASAVRSYFQITAAILFGASIVRKNKALAAVGMVLGVNFIMNTVLSVIGVSALLPRLYLDALGTSGMGVESWLIIQSGVNILLAAVFWWLNVHIAKKSVNIE